jgi:hypothetical protein
MVLSPPALFCLLRTYSLVSKISGIVGSFFSKVYRVFSEDYQPTYVLFENIMHPYNASGLSLRLLASAIPDWYYKPSENVLVQWTFPTDINAKIPPFSRLRSTILSMVILENDRVVFDLTDFLENTKIYGRNMPSVEHIIGAWYISNGIVLDTTSQYIVRHITEDAETVLTPLPWHPAPAPAEPAPAEPAPAEPAPAEPAPAEPLST